MTALPTLDTVAPQAMRDRFLYVLVGLFILLATAWNFVVPPYEKPDEPAHVQYVLYLASERHLPNLWAERDRAGTASFEAPLYYSIAALVLSATGLPYRFNYPTRNPAFSFEDGVGEPNYFLPSSSDGYLYVLRELSVVFGVITISCAYLLAGLLGMSRPIQRASAALVAFLPQFAFMSTAVNNDGLATALSALALVWLLQVNNLAVPRTRDALVLGALFGLAVLTKHHTLVLLFFGLLVLAFKCRTNLKLYFKLAATIVLGLLIVGGWFWLRNLILYGDPLGLNMVPLVAPEQVYRKPSLVVFIALLIQFSPLIFQSFWGVFGWMRIFLPQIFYAVFFGLMIAALLGLIYGVRRQILSPLFQLLLIAPILLLALLVYGNWNYNLNQGRYLLPVVIVLASLLTIGLDVLPFGRRRVLIWAIPVCLMVTNLYSIWLVINVFKSVT